MKFLRDLRAIWQDMMYFVGWETMVLTVVAFILRGVILAAVLWVAIHFIHKYW